MAYQIVRLKHAGNGLVYSVECTYKSEREIWYAQTHNLWMYLLSVCIGKKTDVDISKYIADQKFCHLTKYTG